MWVRFLLEGRLLGWKGEGGGGNDGEREGLQKALARGTWGSCYCWGPKPGNLWIRCFPGVGRGGRKTTQPLSALSEKSRRRWGRGGGGERQQRRPGPRAPAAWLKTEVLSLWPHLASEWIQRPGSSVLCVVALA